MISFIKEFFYFLITRRKYWLYPIFLVLAIFGVIIILGQGTQVAAPFIYAIF